MKGYNFLFTYNGVKYSANVTRIASGKVQYHITDLSPLPENYPYNHSFIMVWNYDRNKFEWGYPFPDAGFIDAMANAAIQAAEEYGIPIP